MTTRSYNSSGVQKNIEKGESSTGKTNSLYQEVEALKKEIEALNLDNTNLVEDNRRQMLIIQEINQENDDLMRLYENRGKLLDALRKEHQVELKEE